MNKKIIFIGPPGTGKTSLRKVFFEGESSKRILDYALKPTIGEESIVLNFHEKIGIFDLAGQENDLWLEISENSVLIDSRIIILVVDCTESIENNLEFIKRVINIRDQFVLDGLIYLLVHKIDLISESDLNDLRLLMQDRLYYYDKVNIAFTSIRREYFPYTFSLFIDILKICIQMNIVAEKSDINLIYNAIFFLHLVNQGNVISKDELHYKLGIAEADFNKTEAFLLSQNLIRINKLGISSIYHLTDKGTSYIINLFHSFSMESLQIFENSKISSRYKQKIDDMRFLGFFMASKSGIPLFKAEIEDDYFERFLNNENRDTAIDTHLISSLISALEMFSSELNIKDLSGFKLKGSNIMIQSFNYELVTISLIVDSETNIKAIQKTILDWFDSFLTKNAEIIDKAIKTGEITKMDVLAKEGRQWLQHLNARYNSLVNNHDIFDINEIQSLYEILDKIPLDSISERQINIVKKLKSELIRTSIEEDIATLRELSKKITKL